MAMKINGIDGSFPIPRLIKSYVYTKFDSQMVANMSDGTQKTVDVKSTLNSAWEGVKQRSKQKLCNDYFKTLFKRESLADVLSGADIVIHQLMAKDDQPNAILPDAKYGGPGCRH